MKQITDAVCDSCLILTVSVCFITVKKYFFLFLFLFSGKASFTFFLYNQMEKTICVFTPCSFIQMPRHTNGPLVVCSVWHISSSSYQLLSTDNSIFVISVIYGCFSNCSHCRAAWQCNWRGKFFSSFSPPHFVYNYSILSFKIQGPFSCTVNLTSLICVNTEEHYLFDWHL